MIMMRKKFFEKSFLNMFQNEITFDNIYDSSFLFKLFSTFNFNYLKLNFYINFRFHHQSVRILESSQALATF